MTGERQGKGRRSGMKTLREWSVFAALVFLCSCARVEAATTATVSGYRIGSSGTVSSTPLGAVVVQVAALNAAHAVGSNSPAHGGNCYSFYHDGYTAYSNTEGYALSDCQYPDGVYQWRDYVVPVGHINAVSSVCAGAGFVYRSDIGLCSNVNDTAGTGGGCKAGQDQRMQAPVTATGNAPYEVEYGGCTFRLAEARSCTVDGVDKACGIWTSTGDTAAGGAGAVAGTGSVADAVTGSGCTSSQIVNVTTGATTCLDSAETKAAYVTTGGVDASGNMVQVTQKCVGSACVQQTTTTPSGGGSSTTVSGPVPAGAGAGMAAAPSITFPSDYARDATVSSLAGNVQQLHTDLTSTSASAPSDPSVKSTDDISGQLLDSSFSTIKAWSMPGRSVSCPTANFTLWGTSYTIDAHCTLWSTVASQVQAVALVSWALLAMFIVLGA